MVQICSNTLVVYHLQAETGWSTICANCKRNLSKGKYRSRLACIICTVHSGPSLTIAAGPKTG